ncbi:hypothetical protein HDU87_007983 [Geranomyces variabilis]|uniref:Uncharacterized protein n=1 Tax=Geranomyces variabilis TaxID=109894 RepID=A0AAD5XPM8_9FUNG|nr:hypothetical protein HDU87_007983 [Geranomyces variabilis]
MAFGSLESICRSRAPIPAIQTANIHTTHHNHNQNTLSSSSSSSASPNPRHKPPTTSATDRHLNIGAATRILRDELPHFPASGLETDDIYADDVAFIEPHRSRLSVRGKRWYKLLAGTVHSGLVIAFAHAELNIVSVQQRGGGRGGGGGGGVSNGDGLWGGGGEEGPNAAHDDTSDMGSGGGDDIQLVVRWIFEGTPRLHPGLVAPQDHPVRSIYEGVFVYRFDAEGKVCEHRLEAIHPEPPFAVNWMAGAFGGGSTAPVATSGQVGIHGRSAKSP